MRPLAEISNTRKSLKSFSLLLPCDNILGVEIIAHMAERKLAPFDDIWGKILDFILHKFEVMSILKECALLQKSPTSEKAWNQFIDYV